MILFIVIVIVINGISHGMDEVFFVTKYRTYSRYVCVEVVKNLYRFFKESSLTTEFIALHPYFFVTKKTHTQILSSLMITK